MIFNYFLILIGKNLFIDLDYKESLPFVHVAEEVAKVSYRCNKTFSGIYIDKNKLGERYKENAKEEV